MSNCLFDDECRSGSDDSLRFQSRTWSDDVGARPWARD